MTVDYRLCNVLVADKERSTDYPNMYVRKSTPTYVREDGVTVLSDPDYAKYDFLTYFNAFSNAKWRRYTTVSNVHLHLEVRGTMDVSLVACEQTATIPNIEVLETHRVEHDDLQVVEFAYPPSDALLLAFTIVAHGQVEVGEAYYFTKVDEAQLRPVELAVAMTTFKNERYVIPNIGLFKDEILGCDEPIAKHFTLHVMDNGRTLDVESLQAERVFVHPNANVGGSGGFTRGMIEAMEQEPRATHVLLMDDDVQVSAESIKRTYNVLALANDTYAEAFVSGAMLSFERQDEFFEDVGYVRPNGTYGPIKETRFVDPTLIEKYYMSNLEDIVAVEATRIYRNNRYAGWWYCCIPVSVIEREGLPLPMFIRCDDLEYGSRCAKHFITMNGICVWHVMFGAKYRAALERYQAPRNFLIAQATTGVFSDIDYLADMHVKAYLDFKTFNYKGVELMIRAFEDFLKGPEFIKHVNCAELNARMMSMNEPLRPVADIDDPVLDGVEYNPSLLYAPKDRSVVDKAYDLLTFNGQRGPRKLGTGGLGVIAYDSAYYSPNEIRGKQALLAVTPDGNEGVLYKKDRARFNELLKRYKAVLKEFNERRGEVSAQWAAAREELTSPEFWKWYLEDQMRTTQDQTE